MPSAAGGGEPTPSVLSVNVGTARPSPTGRGSRTGIFKAPVESIEVRDPGPKRVLDGAAVSGVADDHVGDGRHHGGSLQAVYAVASKELAWWSAELGRELRPGAFGENLTLAGFDVDAALVGERWRIGDEVEVRVTGPRIPVSYTHLAVYKRQGHLNPFAIWEGGIAMFGSLMGGAIGALIAARLYKVRLWAFGDCIAPGIAVAQAVGRLGNWFNQELFGQPSTAPWALEIDLAHRPPGLEQFATFEPTFLYELLLNLLAAAIILKLDKMLRLGHGACFALYIALYGAIRFVIEGMRTDFSYYLGPLRTNQVTACLLYTSRGVHRRPGRRAVRLRGRRRRRRDRTPRGVHLGRQRRRPARHADIRPAG